MADFPVEADVFPILTEERPGQFEARYYNWKDEVRGQVMADASDGSGKRPYLFEVSWPKGEPVVKVSLADSSNKSSFYDRDGPGKPIRELEGMAMKHRPDIRAFAKRVAEFVRDRVFAEHDWLRDQFKCAAILIEVDAKPKTATRFAFLQGWLLIEKTTSWGTTVEAFFLGTEATLGIAKRAAESFVVNRGVGDWRRATSR